MYYIDLYFILNKYVLQILIALYLFTEDKQLQYILFIKDFNVIVIFIISRDTFNIINDVIKKYIIIKLTLKILHISLDLFFYSNIL